MHVRLIILCEEVFMITLKKSNSLLILFVFSFIYVQALPVDQYTIWSRVKDATAYTIHHPLQSIKKCSTVCAKGGGVVLAGSVLGYYAIRSIRAIAARFTNSSVGSQLQILSKPIKKAVIIASLVLLAYECGRSLFTEIKQSEIVPVETNKSMN